MRRRAVLRVICAGLMVGLLAPPWAIAAACDQDPECGDATAWGHFTRVVLRQSLAGSPAAIEWAAVFDHATGDMRIDVIRRGATPMAGTIALVGGHTMLTRGLELPRGAEIDALDGPILSMKLVMIVLGRIWPEGPGQVTGVRPIDHTDRVGIKYATPSASGYLPAPWQVKGHVRKQADGTVAFELALTFPRERQAKKHTDVTMNLRGEFGKRDRPVFTDTDSLAGWTTYRLGPQIVKQGTGTILDYGATPDPAPRSKTIGDIRAAIAAEYDPGARDATKDFTGFWKQKCDQSFGLQIKPYGDEGKYAIVFCGPGGCGDPAQSRPTFITGDKRYQVVNEDELTELGVGGERTTYYRCTKDPHPVLTRQK